MPAPTPLYLPYELVSTLIIASNTNAFGIDPDRTTGIEAGNANPFGIDPELTTLITTGLTP